jgi:hypothetical protein
MRPKEILQKWVEFFNLYDYERLADLYAEDCINRDYNTNCVSYFDYLHSYCYSPGEIYRNYP